MEGQGTLLGQAAKLRGTTPPSALEGIPTSTGTVTCPSFPPGPCRSVMSASPKTQVPLSAPTRDCSEDSTFGGGPSSPQGVPTGLSPQTRQNFAFWALADLPYPLAQPAVAGPALPPALDLAPSTVHPAATPSPITSEQTLSPRAWRD